jgi:predicted ester cyclase
MDAQEMKDTVRRWITGIFDDGNFDLIEELTTQDYSFHLPRPGKIPRDTFPDLVTGFRTAVPDLYNTFHEQFVDGDVVVTRGTTRGTNDGPFGDLPATGNPITSEWVIITRFEGDRISEDREIYDEMGVMMQMGAIPGVE